MTVRTSFVTDTATMCVFDLGALKHRLEDDADWWSIPDEELAELAAGNAAFVGLGEDGRYDVEWAPVTGGEGGAVNCNLRIPTGRVFLGAGEEVTSDGLEPECVRGGMFIELSPGNYALSVARIGPRTLRVYLGELSASVSNARRPLRV